MVAYRPPADDNSNSSTQSYITASNVQHVQNLIIVHWPCGSQILLVFSF